MQTSSPQRDPWSLIDELLRTEGISSNTNPRPPLRRLQKSHHIIDALLRNENLAANINVVPDHSPKLIRSKGLHSWSDVNY